MRHAIWKLTALAGVVGIGLLVVMQAQRGMVRQEEGASKEPGSGVAGEIDKNARIADGSPVPKQMEPLGPEGFSDQEPVPASTKTAGANVRPVQSPSAARSINPPALAGDTDPFEAPEPSPANPPAGQPARPAVALGGSQPRLTDANTFEADSGAEVRPAAVTPIQPRAAAPEREVAMEEPAFEPPATDGAAARGLPAAAEPQEDAAEAAAFPLTPVAQPAQKKLTPAPQRAASGFVDEDEPVASSGPPSEKTTGATRRGPALSDRDEPSEPASPPRTREPQRFIDENERPRPSSSPPASAAGQPAVDADEEFPAPAPPPGSRPRNDAALVQPSLVPEAQQDAVEERPAAAVPEERPAPRQRSSTGPLLGDDEEQPTLAPGAKISPGLAPEAPQPSARPAAPPDAEPLIERPAPPRKPASVPVVSDDADDAPFGGSSNKSAASAPRLTPVNPPPAEPPSAQLPDRPAIPAAPLRDEGPVQTSPSRTYIEQQPAFRDNGPAPNSVPPVQTEIRSDAVRLSPAPAERTMVLPDQRPPDDRTQGQRTNGTQRPHLTIDKIAPPNAMVGQAMIYHIVVRNAGTTSAQQVVVEDRIPDGLRVSGTIPRAELAGSCLIWRIGSLEPGQEQRFSIRAFPLTEGVVGSVATVNFAAEVGARTLVSAPKLRLEIAAPQRATLGAPVVFNYRVTNIGKSDSSGVIIRNVLPAALKHADGDDLEYEVGTLPAGQSREVQLALTAAQQGRTVNRAVVTADGGLSVQAEAEVEVVGPSLTVRRSGPKRMFLNKPAVFTNTVTNGGSALVGNITLVETIPAGLDFVSATADGRFDPAKRTVTWRLERLEPRQAGSVDVTLTSTARGPQVSVVRAYDGGGASGEAMGTTSVAGVAALSIDISELAAPIVLGERLACKIRVFNRGSETATNVRLAVAVPAGLQVTTVKGPGNYRRAADQLQFDPIPRLDSKNEATIELTLQAAGAGEARLEVLVQSDQMVQPLRNERATTIVTSQE